MSAKCHEADIERQSAVVCFVPEADIKAVTGEINFSHLTRLCLEILQPVKIDPRTTNSATKESPAQGRA
jgi:hypothetical protein